jgi:hypothetical protein
MSLRAAFKSFVGFAQWQLGFGAEYAALPYSVRPGRKCPFTPTLIISVVFLETLIFPKRKYQKIISAGLVHPAQKIEMFSGFSY